ncbi:MAG: cytochrome c oxidase subunit 3 [Planctomycetota bacterium]|jgi:cytochrome c oxidase subunit 3
MTAIDSRPSRPAAGVPPADAHADHPHLAHHFDAPIQQFEAAKLGMWLFLATELLLFGGLFCAYAVVRGNNPEIFEYGSQFLDTRWGALNTAVLILSSMSMAAAVTAAQRNQKRWLIALLLMTFMGGAVFMAVKYIEYHHKFHEGLVWGEHFYERPAWAVPPSEAGADALAADAAPAEHVVDLDNGKALWTATCRSCHGAAGEGVAGQGKDIRGAAFVAERTDAEMLAFFAIGRQADDPLNTTGIQMPPRGGNPLLDDGDLLDILALVRTFVAPEGAAEEPAGAEDAPAAPEAFWIPVSSIPDAPAGPAGIVRDHLEPEPAAITEPHDYPHHSVDPERPPNAHVFFGIYFLMTGLHGFHVLVGMAVIFWLAVRAILGHFGPEYFTPVDLGGLYWHVVDLIWIFLFPLLYLIG